MTEVLRKIYIDEDDNLQFENQLLEELNQKQLITALKTEPRTLETLLGNLVENTEENREPNLKQIAEFMIEKITGKKSDVHQ